MMRRSIRAAGWLVMMAALFSSPMALEAQQRGQRGQGRMGPPQERADLEQRVRQRFGQVIQTRLGLDDEQARQLSEIMAGFQENRMQLMREEQALRRRVEAVLLEGAVSDDEAGTLLGRLIELREREADLFRSEQEELMQVLTPYQLLQFHVMREQLNERVRALGQQGGMRRPGGGTGPGGDSTGRDPARGGADLSPWIGVGSAGPGR